MESLPVEFWTIYAMIFIFTLVSSIVYWVKQRYSALSAMAMVLSLLIPLVTLVYTAQRDTGNEYQYIRDQLTTFEWLAITLVVGYLFIIAWFLLVFVEGMRKLYHIPFINNKLNFLFKEKLHPLWKKWINYIKKWKFVQKVSLKIRSKKEHKVNESESEIQ